MKTFGSLHRDPSKGKIAGVCAGIAEYFGMEIWLVRILTLTGFFLLAPPFFFVGYIAAWFILDKKDPTTTHTSSSTKTDDPLEVKFKVWQKGEPPRRALQDLKERLGRVDSRLQDMERHVTSSEFTVSREINKL